MVDYQITSYSEQPVGKLTVVGIIAALNSHNSLDKCLLKDILCQLGIITMLGDIIKKLRLMPLEQHVKSLRIALSVGLHQLVVGELC